MDDTGRAARERVSGELTLEKAFGTCVRTHCVNSSSANRRRYILPAFCGFYIVETLPNSTRNKEAQRALCLSIVSPGSLSVTVCAPALGLKRKVNSQRERRGGVPAKGNPGDKLFHHVDYSPGFHQSGEFVVGSSFYRCE